MVLSVSSPILSHTLTVTVVLWPKFGHSTTLNSKGFKAHKGEVFHNLAHIPNFVENIILTHTLSHELRKKVHSVLDPTYTFSYFGCTMTIANFSTHISTHAHPPGGAIGLVGTS